MVGAEKLSLLIQSGPEASGVGRNKTVPLHFDGGRRELADRGSSLGPTRFSFVKSEATPGGEKLGAGFTPSAGCKTGFLSSSPRALLCYTPVVLVDRTFL